VRIDGEDVAVLGRAAKVLANAMAQEQAFSPVDDAEQMLAARLDTPREWRATSWESIWVLVLAVDQVVD
jgi:hypothetical protein